MVIFEEAAELWHLHEVYFLLLNLAFVSHTVFEGAEFADELKSSLVILFDAGRDLALLWVNDGLPNSMSWSN